MESKWRVYVVKTSKDGQVNRLKVFGEDFNSMREALEAMIDLAPIMKIYAYTFEIEEI